MWVGVFPLPSSHLGRNFNQNVPSCTCLNRSGGKPAVWILSDFTQIEKETIFNLCSTTAPILNKIPSRSSQGSFFRNDLFHNVYIGNKKTARTPSCLRNSICLSSTNMFLCPSQMSYVKQPVPWHLRVGPKQLFSSDWAQN